MIEERLKELGIALPEAVAPVANYVPGVITGNLLFLSGQLPLKDGAPTSTGICGAEVSVEDGATAARQCALNLLAQAKAVLGGDIERIQRCVKLTCFVASASDFTKQPVVANGCSDMMVEILGDKGRHSRSAVGVASLPLNVPVEVEAIFEISA